MGLGTRCYVKKDLNLQIHQHKAFLSDDQFLGSVHKSFLNQTTPHLRNKWSFLNQELSVSTYRKLRKTVFLEMKSNI